MRRNEYSVITSAQSSTSGKQTTQEGDGLPKLDVCILSFGYALHTNHLSVTVVETASGIEISLGIGPESATTKKKAKDIAAKLGFEWLGAQFPSVDLSDI
jgi:hypothetical protein